VPLCIKEPEGVFKVAVISYMVLKTTSS
jgi:hypothetical protein